MVAIEFILVAVGTILAALGWIIQKLYQRIQSTLDRIDSIEEDIDALENQSDTLMSFLFGRERVPDDDGLTEEVREGLEEINDEVEGNSEDIEEIEDVVDVVVIRLHNSDNIEFDKRELDNVVELGVNSGNDESLND